MWFGHMTAVRKRDIALEPDRSVGEAARRASDKLPTQIQTRLSPNIGLCSAILMRPDLNSLFMKDSSLTASSTWPRLTKIMSFTTPPVSHQTRFPQQRCKLVLVSVGIWPRQNRRTRTRKGLLNSKLANCLFYCSQCSR